MFNIDITVGPRSPRGQLRLLTCLAAAIKPGVCIGIGAQSTLGGARHFCPKNMYEKLTKCPNFTWFIAEKLIKYPNFFIIFGREMNKIPNMTWFLPENARILHNNCPKNIFPNFFAPPPPAPSPMPMGVCRSVADVHCISVLHFKHRAKCLQQHHGDVGTERSAAGLHGSTNHTRITATSSQKITTSWCRR